MSSDRDFTDPALDALLRSDPDAAPPAHVDAAILAAAHRAVARAPCEAERALARPSWRSWMPLAAAAVVATIVIGVLPLAPTPPDATAPVVTDGSANAAREQPAAAGSPRADAAREQRAAAGSPPATATQERPRAAGGSSAAAPHDTPATRHAAETGLAGAPSPSSIPSPALAERERPSVSATSPPPAQARPSAAAASPPGRQEIAASKQLSMRRDTSAAAESPDDSAARRAADGIARMRALRSEGRLADAARELARFRAAFSDADARLPADLRTWAAAVPR